MTMFKAASARSQLSSASGAARECIATVESSGIPDPDFIFLLTSCVLPLEEIGREIRQRWPHARIHASTSCLGAMTEADTGPAAASMLAMLAIADSSGDYGTAAGTFDQGARTAGRQLMQRALQSAGRAGEFPPLVLVSATPGQEEEFLAGLQDVVGPDTPIVGGSAADNDLSGQWCVLGDDGALGNGAVVSALFASVAVSTAFESGYAPTANRGIVMRADGRRVFEIDHQPAAAVYERWTEGAVRRATTDSVNVLMKSALMPLGRIGSYLDDMPLFKLSHPETIAADGSMTLFTRVTEGEALVMMRGTPSTLVSRAESVVRSACRIGDIDTAAVSAVIVFYCGGCMLQVADRLGQIRAALAGVAPASPVIVGFTFGEQGPLPLGPIQHGNLMISTIVFGGR